MEGSCGHGNEPSGSINAGKFLSRCTIVSFSRRARIHKVSYLVSQLVNIITRRNFNVKDINGPVDLSRYINWIQTGGPGFDSLQ